MPIIAQLVITMDEKGKIEVQGCIENKLMSLGLLEIAKDSIHKFNDAKETRIVAPPMGLDANSLKVIK